MESWVEDAGERVKVAEAATAEEAAKIEVAEEAAGVRRAEGPGHTRDRAEGSERFYGGQLERPQQQLVIREQSEVPDFNENQAAMFFPEFSFFIDQQGLGPVFNDTPIVVMGSGVQLRELQRLHGETKVRDHQRAFQYLRICCAGSKTQVFARG